jgi:hypothetical protein
VIPAISTSKRTDVTFSLGGQYCCSCEALMRRVGHHRHGRHPPCDLGLAREKRSYILHDLFFDLGESRASGLEISVPPRSNSMNGKARSMSHSRIIVHGIVLMENGTM